MPGPLGSGRYVAAMSTAGEAVAPADPQPRAWQHGWPPRGLGFLVVASVAVLLGWWSVQGGDGSIDLGGAGEVSGSLLAYALPAWLIARLGGALPWLLLIPLLVAVIDAAIFLGATLGLPDDGYTGIFVNGTDWTLGAGLTVAAIAWNHWHGRAPSVASAVGATAFATATATLAAATLAQGWDPALAVGCALAAIALLWLDRRAIRRHLWVAAAIAVLVVGVALAVHGWPQGPRKPIGG